jgi:hypothetical protein
LVGNAYQRASKLLADPVCRFNVVQNGDTHFPFLTAQWKAPTSGKNQVNASTQAARDGALIVNYMHKFYAYAYPQDPPPTQLETCHFSLTTEGYTIILWIHWREVSLEDGEVYFRMEPVEAARMIKLEDLKQLRTVLHNYIDFAIGERLRSIKAALPAFWANRPAKKAKSAKSQTSTTATPSEWGFHMPPTPSMSSGEGADRDEVAPKKKRRVADI